MGILWARMTARQLIRFHVNSQTNRVSYRICTTLYRGYKYTTLCYGKQTNSHSVKTNNTLIAECTVMYSGKMVIDNK